MSTLLKKLKLHKHQLQQNQEDEIHLSLSKKLIEKIKALPKYGHLSEDELHAIASTIISLSNVYYSIFQNQQINPDDKK